MLNFKLKFWNDQPVLVIVLQITIFALLLLALIICLATLGVFGKQWEDTKDHLDHDGNVDVCFLFLPKQNAALGKNSYCDFIVASHSIILIALLILLVVLAIIVFLRLVYSSQKLLYCIFFNNYSCLFYRLSIGFDLVAFLVIAIVTVIFSLTASIVLSSGFAKTCSTIKDISSFK